MHIRISICTHIYIHAHSTYVYTYIHTLTKCISAVCDGGLGGSGDNSQVGGLMFLSSDTAAIERLCFTGNGGGSSLTYNSRLYRGYTHTTKHKIKNIHA